MIAVQFKDGRVNRYPVECKIYTEVHGISIMLKIFKEEWDEYETVGIFWWKRKKFVQRRKPWDMRCLLYIPTHNLLSVEREELV